MLIQQDYQHKVCLLFGRILKQTPIFDWCSLPSISVSIPDWGFIFAIVITDIVGRLGSLLNACLKKIGLHLQSLLHTQQLGGPMYSIKKSTNNALLITITKSGEVQIVLMLHHRFANATHVLLCNLIGRI